MGEYEDPSWHFCGLAVNSAMQMALHQAVETESFDGFGGKKESEVNRSVRAMTWMACFQVSSQ